MRVFLIFSLLFSAVICASLVHQPDDDSNLKEKLLLRGRKDADPPKLNRWLPKVEVFDECTNSVYTEPNGGLISSPNYPGGYSDYINCTYLIDLRASSAQTVLLQLLDLQTEEAFDTVNVYDGPSVNDRLLLSASGFVIPGSVQSSTGQMLVTFITDGAVSDIYSGFSAMYSNGGPPGPPTGCGVTYTKMTGNITSMNYPGVYANNLNCQYSIDLRSSGASSVTLTFLEFKTEGCCDHLYVYEGLSTSGVLLLDASGSTIPRTVVSSTSQMLVIFTTDESYVDKGFLATYQGI